MYQNSPCDVHCPVNVFMRVYVCTILREIKVIIALKCVSDINNEEPQKDKKDHDNALWLQF